MLAHLKIFKSEVAISLTAIALNNVGGGTDLEELDQKVKSMMTSSENIINKRKARICKVCGKEGQMNNIMYHIEANHITDISIPCNACDKILHTRTALLQHNKTYHSQIEMFNQ